MILGPDGALWFADGANVGRIDLNTKVFTAIAEPNGATINAVASAPADGSGGAVWYAATLASTTTNGYVGRIGAAGPTYTAVSKAITGVPIVSNGDANGIVAGLDGSVWFTDERNRSVNHMKFTAAFNSYSKFTIPVAGATPYWITVGPDGTLWFSDTSNNALGHIVP